MKILNFSLKLFLEKLCLEKNKKPIKYNRRLADIIEKYPWPGNVRELSNAITNVVVFSENDKVNKERLQEYLKNTTIKKKKSLKNRFGELSEVERKKLVISAYQKTNGNKQATARELGITRPTVYRYLKMKESKPM